MRKISYGEGVERVFPIFSPLVDSVEVVRHGRVRRAYIGVSGATVPIATRVVRHFGLTNRSAVHVLEIVPGSPAARAGVEVGDRMVAIDGTPIDGIDALQRLLDPTWIGRHCELKILRRSSLVHVSLMPVEVPAMGTRKEEPLP